jgi:hypothetical protein
MNNMRKMRKKLIKTFSYKTRPESESTARLKSPRTMAMCFPATGNGWSHGAVT